MVESDQTDYAIELARETVARAAPHELPMFQATLAAYLKNPPKKINKNGKDEMLGFGAGEAAAFITPIAISAAKEVIGYITEQAKKTLKTESADAVSGFIEKQFKKDRPEAKPAAKTVPDLSRDQIAEVHKIAYRQALAFKMTEDRAKLFADAMVGRLLLSKPARA